MVNKKEKPNKKRKRPDDDRDLVMSRQKYNKRDRQDAEEDIWSGLEKWERGEYEE